MNRMNNGNNVMSTGHVKNGFKSSMHLRDSKNINSTTSATSNPNYIKKNGIKEE